ncbi:GtrA family protein [Novosphingobium sp. BL-8H]|uniref:GtrA family protein n=1 Tax=Novosphingobium sp. BL-8H TaxID=3127640 RepID=UPI0037579900
MKQVLPPATTWRGELATLIRFVLVGAANTAIGYALILCWLYAGLGDYAANVAGFAMGLPISWALHRKLTFRARHRPDGGELVRYVLAFLTAYGANLAVIVLGRAAGLGAGGAGATGVSGSALLQGLAVCTYAAVLFVLTRLIVFRGRPV